MAMVHIPFLRCEFGRSAQPDCDALKSGETTWASGYMGTRVGAARDDVIGSRRFLDAVATLKAPSARRTAL